MRRISRAILREIDAESRALLTAQRIAYAVSESRYALVKGEIAMSTGPYNFEKFDDATRVENHFIGQDIAFIAAVNAGLEQVPMFGVDTRPCTQFPRYVAPRSEPARTGSPIGDLTISGRGSS